MRTQPIRTEQSIVKPEVVYKQVKPVTPKVADLPPPKKLEVAEISLRPIAGLISSEQIRTVV